MGAGGLAPGEDMEMQDLGDIGAAPGGGFPEEMQRK